ncbi:acetyltransferase, partial [Rhizobium leguminosarum]
MSRKLGIEPYFHETATVSDSTFGRYTEVSERCRISEATFGDYSY